MLPAATHRHSSFWGMHHAEIFMAIAALLSSDGAVAGVHNVGDLEINNNGGLLTEAQANAAHSCLTPRTSPA